MFRGEASCPVVTFSDVPAAGRLASNSDRDELFCGIGRLVVGGCFSIGLLLGLVGIGGMK